MCLFVQQDLIPAVAQSANTSRRIFFCDEEDLECKKGMCACQQVTLRSFVSSSPQTIICVYSVSTKSTLFIARLGWASEELFPVGGQIMDFSRW